MDAKDRILQYLDLKGVSKNSFYNKVGLSNGYLDTGGSINTDKLSKITEVFGDINLEYIVRGIGSPIREETSRNEVTFHPAMEDQGQYRVRRGVPLYDMEATAGNVTVFDDLMNQGPIAEISIPDLPKCDGAVYIRGDSMYPILKSGDISSR